MRFISTRGDAPVLSFEEVLLAGLARDGGLYVPETWPTFTSEQIASWKALPYSDLAQRIMKPFVEDTLTEAELKEICDGAYGAFAHEDVIPLTDLGGGFHLMDLTCGPTLAFKDVAMRALARMFDTVLTRRGEKVTIVGATSGDTGAAAVDACGGLAALDVFMLLPKGRVSPVQERQMTTATAENLHVIQIDGTFDDCQDLVKAMFNDQPFRDRFKLSAVNSINWARVMAQIVYYFWAALKLGGPEKPVSFCVPSGNFGNVFAGYGAKLMGLPIEQLVTGSNTNNILARFFQTGAMEMRDVVATISPSMDIQVPSNFERLLFDLMDRDGAKVAETLTNFRETGTFKVTADQLAVARDLFDGDSYDDAATKDIIADIYKTKGFQVCPHTATGIGAAKSKRASGTDTLMVILATAHPAKFSAAVTDATGEEPRLPEHLKDLFDRPTKAKTLPNDLGAVQELVIETLGEALPA